MRARLDAAEKYSETDSLHAGNKYLAEEQPLLFSQMQMMRWRTVETARQVNRLISFTVALIILILSMYLR